MGSNPRPLINGVALASLCLIATRVGAADAIEYVLTPILKSSTLTAVEVSLKFRGRSEGVTQLQLPDTSGGERELWRSISNLDVRHARMEFGATPAQRVLRHARNASITVRYRIVQESADYLQTVRGNAYRPVVQPTYFHLMSSASLIRPDLDRATPVRVRAASLPSTWSFASDLQHRGATLDDVGSSVLVGGDFKVLHPSPSNPNLRVVLRGSWSFNDAIFAERSAQILDAQRRFWGAAPTPYLVTVLQTSGSVATAGGNGLGDGFALFASINLKDDGVISSLLAHEGMHTWIPEAIGSLPEDTQQLGYWLSEGFTDFYRSRLLLRQGIWTVAEFVADLNNLLRGYAASPVRTANNERILADFRKDDSVRKLPYQRGHLLAHLWNGQLQTRGSLDAILFDMHRRATLSAKGTERKFARELLVDAMAAVGLDIRDNLVNYVDKGVPILLPENLLAPCGRIETRETPVFDWGFDFAATLAANMRLTHVDPGSEAYAAGVREGMLYVRRDAGQVNDSEQELALRVNDGGTERVFRYFPQGKARVLLQQFILDDALQPAALEACRKRLAGA